MSTLPFPALFPFNDENLSFVFSGDPFSFVLLCIEMYIVYALRLPLCVFLSGSGAKRTPDCRAHCHVAQPPSGRHLSASFEEPGSVAKKRRVEMLHGHYKMPRSPTLRKIQSFITVLISLFLECLLLKLRPLAL